MEAVYEETGVRVIEEVESSYTLVDFPLSKKKKKRKGSIQHAEKHKKPRSAYLLYYFDVHQSLQQEHPDMPQSEINKRISDSWKRLTVADKAYYLERAKKEKDGPDPTIQSTATSRDIPGFRKILPRTNYVFLPKTSLGEKWPGTTIEVSMKGGNDTARQEAPQEPLCLGSEVDLVEQCLIVEPCVEDTVVTSSRTVALRTVLPQYNPSARRLLTFPQHGCNSTTLLMKEDGGVSSSGDYDVRGAAMSQFKADNHLVAIIPNHELIENKVLPAASPIMMLPVMNQVKPDPKPSVKLSIKYTRRGRGNCSTPGCSFTYVTRHKPPRCPECGQHLGGKWVSSLQAAKGICSSPSAGKLKGQADVSSSSSVATDVEVQSTFSAAEIKSEETEVHTKDKDNDATTFVAAASETGLRQKDKTSVVVDKQPIDGTLVRSTTDSPCAGSAAASGLSSSLGVISKGQAAQKRRIRTILPAPVAPKIPLQSAIVQWIAVPSNKIKGGTNITTKTVKSTKEKTLGLKPSTLKQLGHSVPLSATDQKPAAINSGQYIVTDSGVKLLSMVPLKQNSSSSLALGLSTARGRGRCKNPSCDYVYKNRHKPQCCPNCGCELSSKPAKKAKVLASPELENLSTVLEDPLQPLSLAQRELQRQSTVTLLKHTLQYPENEAELQDILTLIHNLNQTHTLRNKEGDRKEDGKEDQTFPQNGWPSFFEPAVTHCGLCHYLLYRGGEGGPGGEQQCWLLTESLLEPVTLQLKMCLNTKCLAMHSFTGLHPGLFNVGNQLLASLDLFFTIRSQIKLGQNPALAALNIINNTHKPPGFDLSHEEQTRVQELLCTGYWAFECMTVRDYNDMICGVCGIAPKLEIAQHSTDSVLQLKNVEFTWPEFQASDEVLGEEFWLAMENEALEQCAFPSSVSITRFDASIIAPFFPPLMRSAVVINTEKDKITSSTANPGDPSMLVRLIHDGQLKPQQMNQHTEEELRSVLEQCGIPPAPDSTKDELMVSVCLFYTKVQNGLSTAPEPPQHLTAGKLSKLCPHKVVCGSKYLVRRETARDHIDLLVSSHFWPPVYVADCAQKVALCAETVYPELASQMWGKNQGCFSDPMAAPEYVSCPELQDQQCNVDLSTVESNPHLHPYTKSSSCYIVHPGVPFCTSLSSSDPHRALTLCKELQSYSSIVSTISGGTSANECKPVEEGKQKMIVFDNPAHYYLYNRLMDFLSSRDIVSLQMGEVLRECQQGEVVMIRDALYRLGVAQLNREEELEEGHMGEEGGSPVVVVEDMALE